MATTSDFTVYVIEYTSDVLIFRVGGNMGILLFPFLSLLLSSPQFWVFWNAKDQKSTSQLQLILTSVKLV